MLLWSSCPVCPVTTVEGSHQSLINLCLSTDILPKKILARDYLKTLEKMQEEEADV